MTDRRIVQRYALAAAAQGRIAAMQAENDARRFKGLSPAYYESSFRPEIEKLEAVADSLCEVPE